MSHNGEAAAGPLEIRVVKLDPTLTLAELVERAELAKRNREIVLRTPATAGRVSGPQPRSSPSASRSR